VSTTAAESATTRDKRMARFIAAELRDLAYELFPPIEDDGNGDAPREWDDVILGSANAGASYVYTVSGSDVLPQSVFCRLTCSAAVGDRTVAVEYQLPSGQVYCVAGANVTLQATQVGSFCWHPNTGQGSWPVDGVALAGLPQQTLTNGRRLVVKLGGGSDAADQLDLIAIAARLTIPSETQPEPPTA
jgi:hypothetical protein